MRAILATWAATASLLLQLRAGELIAMWAILPGDGADDDADGADSGKDSRS